MRAFNPIEKRHKSVPITKCPVCNKSLINGVWVWFFSKKYQSEKNKLWKWLFPKKYNTVKFKLCPKCKAIAFPLCPSCEKPVDKCFSCGNI